MLAETIVAEARKYIGTVEQPLGSNSGPPIDGWLAFVSAEPGDPWCAAFACSIVHDARVAEKLAALTFRRSSSAMRLLLLNQALKTDDPQPGDLIIGDHGGGKGHVSIKTGPTSHIAGNTSPDGKSRNGYGVFEHEYDAADPKIAGCIRVS